VPEQLLLTASDTVCARAVEPLFQALCRGAEDNPDELEEGEGEFFFDQAGLQGLEAGVQQQLDNMVGRMDIGDIPAPDAAHGQPNGVQSDANAQHDADQEDLRE
jgi:hypothetical protein